VAITESRTQRFSTESVFDRVTGHPFVARLAASVAGTPLRVLAFHDISDGVGFRAQMEHIVDRYTPVNSDQVVAWTRGAGLPARAVWVTFDDGDPSVVEIGVPVLADLGVKATLFVCPGVIGTTEPFWWQVAAAVAPDEVTAMKSMIDAERSRRVAEMHDRYRRRTGHSIERVQLTEHDIDLWLNSGNDIGNHTWDHPMLDQCGPSDQIRQIERAHEWLMDRVRPRNLIFAYPNGTRTDIARDTTSSLGYSLAMLFDHAVVSAPGFEMSRLRTNADGQLERFRSIVSGLHPAVHRLRAGRSSH
jgi:peptidoglycan/xylan/chitin deacetylase (PgdA/CDA1 family)